VYDLATLRFLEVNDAATRIYGWTRDEFLTMTLRDIRPPSELARLDTLVREAHGRQLQTASLHRTKSGVLRRVQISSYALEFAGHSARMVLVDDVTDRLAAEKALASSQQRYRSVIDQMQDVFFQTDEHGNWTFLNPAWTVLTGHEIERSLGTHVLTYIHPSDRSILLDAFDTLVHDSGASSLVEVRLFRRDGGYRWVEASARPIESDAGARAGTMGTLRDVTQRHTAAEERQRLATNIRQLLDASGEGIYGLDTQGIVTFINRKGSEMLGYDADELIGQQLHRVAHHTRANGSPYPIEECPIWHAASNGVACEVDDEVLWRKDGQPLQVEYAASPVIERGRVSGAVVNFRDVTARKRAELELIVARDAAEAASRAKSDFLARMSHELRTPLNSIIGFANVLLKNKHGDLSDANLSYLGRIAANGRHLLGLINDILDLSKIEAGRMTLELGSVRLDTLVSETASECEGQIRDRPVVLRTELPATVNPALTDEGRLKQVLINLIGNALKFTDRGEVVVRLETDSAGDPARLSVRDTGIGIPADRLDAIFNVFEQAESMITRRFGGTGLGLAISRSLCDLMGHRLEVTSVEGEGTTMTIHFDARSVGALALSTATPVFSTRAIAYDVASADDGPQMVLIVDDDPDACVLLANLVEEAGHQSVSASTGVEGLRLAREIRPALVLLDLRLPKISGFDVLRLLQADEVLRTTPVVIVSVIGTESRGALAGAADVLDKPLERERVLEALHRYLPVRAL
jgi:PAS domain S-box-containing protein